MHLCEAVADLADLIRNGRLDRVQETVTDLHRDGLCRRQLNRALANAAGRDAMNYCIATLAVRQYRVETKLDFQLVWQRRLAFAGLGWMLQRSIRSIQAQLRQLKADMAFLAQWAQEVEAYEKRQPSAPVSGAVCMLREAARAHRRYDYERGRRLYQRAVKRFGEDEVTYVIEAFRLSFTPLPRVSVERPRVKSGFAA